MSGRLDGGSSFTDLHLVRELNGVKTVLPKINSGAERLNELSATVSRPLTRAGRPHSRPSASGRKASRATAPARDELRKQSAGAFLSGEISFRSLTAMLLMSLCISSVTLVLAAQEMAR